MNRYLLFLAAFSIAAAPGLAAAGTSFSAAGGAAVAVTARIQARQHRERCHHCRSPQFPRLQHDISPRIRFTGKSIGHGSNYRPRIREPIYIRYSAAHIASGPIFRTFLQNGRRRGLPKPTSAGRETSAGNSGKGLSPRRLARFPPHVVRRHPIIGARRPHPSVAVDPKSVGGSRPFSVPPRAMPRDKRTLFTMAGSNHPSSQSRSPVRGQPESPALPRSSRPSTKAASCERPSRRAQGSSSTKAWICGLSPVQPCGGRPGAREIRGWRHLKDFNDISCADFLSASGDEEFATGYGQRTPGISGQRHWIRRSAASYHPIKRSWGVTPHRGGLPAPASRRRWPRDPA